MQPRPCEVQGDGDGSDDEAYAWIVDATFAGNFTRFINHRCRLRFRV
jgi:hypothetical protein